MGRGQEAPAGRALILPALVAAAALLGAAQPACAQADLTARPPAPVADRGRLSLETAVPRPVPPAPRVGTPKPIAAPPRFAPLQPLEVPPAPDLNALASVATPPPPSAAAPKPAAAPAPAPAIASAPAPAQPAQAQPPQPPTQSAALAPPPPAAPAPRAAALTVTFDPASAELPDSAESTVANLAERLRANESLRLQLRAYAGGTPETAREARQLSLSRALALRERLTAFGVRSTRIDIRALGATASEGPHDRIDVEFLNE